MPKQDPAQLLGQDEPSICVIRHGQALHNVERGYPHRDPPLTALGRSAASQITLSYRPDLILVSPMTRTIDTALIVLQSHRKEDAASVPIVVCPDLREAHDAECNKGLPRAVMQSKYPNLDFLQCPENWDYEMHTPQAAIQRAERVRKLLKEFTSKYQNILLISHRGFLAFLVQGYRFEVCETRSYHFAKPEEVAGLPYGTNVDKEVVQDFGPTLLKKC